jgi:hypothetical protein
MTYQDEKDRNARRDRDGRSSWGWIAAAVVAVLVLGFIFLRAPMHTASNNDPSNSSSMSRNAPVPGTVQPNNPPAPATRPNG